MKHKVFLTAILMIAMSITTNAVAQNYDFSAVAPTGQTLYYRITNSSGHTVAVTHPALGTRSNAWNGYTMPTDSLAIPATVSYNSTSYTVVTIDYYAFYYCSGLTSVTIPNSVTSIGREAFDNCSGLTSVTIGGSVTSIGDDAFYECSGLTSVTIPGSVISIGFSAFSGCNVLASVTIGDSVTSIGEYAFQDCSGLTSIVVESGNTHYDSRNNCNAIIETATNTLIQGCNNTIIPNTVTSIGTYAFYKCSGLTSLTIPNSVTSIGEYAFQDCSGLTSLTIPNSVTSIGNYAFYYCSGLTSVTIPNSVTSIGSYAFCNCSGLTSVTIGGSVTSIGNYAFFSCSGLTSVTIPNSVTSIGSSAFGVCSGLTSVTIGGSVTSIGDNAFVLGSGLTSITSLATVPPTLGNGVFYAVPDTIPVYVPCNYVAAYRAANGWNYFSNIQCLTETPNVTANPSDTIYGTVTGGGRYPAGDTATLTAIPNCGYVFTQWSDGVTANPRILVVNIDTTITAQFTTGTTKINQVCSTGQTLYYNLDCTNNTATVTHPASGYMYAWSGHVMPTGNITIPSSVTYNGTTYSVTAMDTNTFCGCSGLTSVTIPNSITSIGGGAFSDCSGLTSVTIPNSVTSIGNAPFFRCSSLTSLVVASGSTHYDSRNNCNAIIETATNTLIQGCQTSIIPNTVTTIGQYAFDNCSGLTSITIPNSVTYIDYAAFLGCNDLTSVSIGGSVTSIGADAFKACIGLTSITSLAIVPPTLGYTVFMLVPDTIPVYVPCSSVAAYRAASGWNGFSNIQGLSEYPVYTDTSITACDSYLWASDSTTYTSSGTYINSHTDADGCPVTDTLHLTIYHDSSSSYTVSVNGGYTWLNHGNSASYYTSDTYTNSYTTAEGCSGVDTLHLTVTPEPLPSNVPASGLMAYYPFNGNAADVSGNGNHGTLGGANGGPAITTDRNGNASSCYEFGGYNSPNWIDVPNSSTLQLDTVLSVSFWAQECYRGGTDGYGRFSTTNYNYGVIAKGGDGNSCPPGVWIYTAHSNEFTDGFMRTTMNNSTSYSNYIISDIGQSVTNHQDCDWLHCVMIIDGRHLMFYHNGQLAMDTMLANRADFSAANNQDMHIGIEGGHFWNPRDGKLDDIGLWNRALTEREVLMLYGVDLPPLYTVRAISSNATMGQASVVGDTLVQQGDTVTIGAAANSGYEFIYWSDGNTDNPRTVTVNSDTTFTAIFAAIEPLPSNVPANGLMAYYPMDDHPFDISGNGNHGTLQGDSSVPVAAVDRHGDSTGCYKFGGVNNPNWIKVSNSTTLRLDTALSVSFWLQECELLGMEGWGNPATTDFGLTVVAKGGDGIATPPGFVVGGGYSSSSGFHWSISNRNTRYNDDIANEIYPTYNLCDWMHCVMTVDGSHVRIWYNGVLALDTLNAQVPSFTAANNQDMFIAIDGIGQGIGGGRNYWYPSNCKMDDIGLWNRALTEQEILALYGAQEPATPIYTVQATSSNVTMGRAEVVGDSQVQEGATATVRATANVGYRFVRWSNGATANPYTFTVVQDTMLTAVFAGAAYTVTVLNSNSRHGIVSGSGTATFGSRHHIAAAPNNGYRFDRWSDGDTTASRYITVLRDTTLTAYFSTNYYVVYVVSSNLAHGTASGGGTYAYRSNITVSANPNQGYAFDHWSDGDTSNPRQIEVLNARTLTAYFVRSIPTYTLSVTSADPTMGSTFGGGTYEEGTTATIRAAANEGYEFDSWTDGVTSNPRSVTILSDTAFTATFRAVYVLQDYTVTLTSNNASFGRVSGSGTYREGSTAYISAYPSAHCHFVRWSDGNATAQRTLTVTSDITLTATFAPDSVEIVARANDGGLGRVAGGGLYAIGDEASLTATPNSGSRFLRWSTGEREQTITITVRYAATYTAYFERTTQGIDEAENGELRAWSHAMTIHVAGLTGQPVKVYDLTGRLIADRLNAMGDIVIPVSYPGLYLVQTGTTTHKVLVR